MYKFEIDLCLELDLIRFTDMEGRSEEFSLSDFCGVDYSVLTTKNYIGAPLMVLLNDLYEDAYCNLTLEDFTLTVYEGITRIVSIDEMYLSLAYRLMDEYNYYNNKEAIETASEIHFNNNMWINKELGTFNTCTDNFEAIENLDLIEDFKKVNSIF